MGFKPPKAAQRNATRALKCKELGSDAGTRVGWYRATQLSQGKELSYDVVKRMASFERHRENAKYKGNLCDDRGKVMWDAWGGDEGISWARRLVKKNKK